MSEKIQRLISQPCYAGRLDSREGVKRSTARHDRGRVGPRLVHHFFLYIHARSSAAYRATICCTRCSQLSRPPRSPQPWARGLRPMLQQRVVRARRSIVSERARQVIRARTSLGRRTDPADSRAYTAAASRTPRSRYSQRGVHGELRCARDGASAALPAR